MTKSTEFSNTMFIKIWYSHYKAIQKLPRDLGNELLRAMADYQVTGVEPDFSKSSVTYDGKEYNLLQPIWDTIFFSLKKTRDTTLAGHKGGKAGGKASKRNNPNGRRGKKPQHDDEQAEVSPQHDDEQAEVSPQHDDEQAEVSPYIADAQLFFRYVQPCLSDEERIWRATITEKYGITDFTGAFNEFMGILTERGLFDELKSMKDFKRMFVYLYCEKNSTRRNKRNNYY